MNKEQLRTYLNNPEWKELDENLVACGINVHKGDYDEQDKELVKQYRELISPNEELKERYQQDLNARGEKPHREVLEEFLVENGLQNIEKNLEEEEDDSTDDTQSTSKKPGKKKKKMLATFDLLKEGTKKTKKPMTLSRATELLEVCGLQEKPEYTPEEAERFLETCDLVINQGMSLAEVVKKFNTTSSKNNLFSSAGGIAQPSTQKALARIAQTGNQLSYQMVQAYQQAWFQQVEEMLTNGEFEKAYEEEREKLCAEVGEPWDYINAQFQMEMNRLKGDNMRMIEGTVEHPQLPPDK